MSNIESSLFQSQVFSSTFECPKIYICTFYKVFHLWLLQNENSAIAIRLKSEKFKTELNLKWSHSGLTHCPSQGAFTPFSPSLTPPDPLQSFSHACLAPSPLIRSHPTNLKHLYSVFELYVLICHRLCSVSVMFHLRFVSFQVMFQ